MLACVQLLCVAKCARVALDRANERSEKVSDKTKTLPDRLGRAVSNDPVLISESFIVVPSEISSSRSSKCKKYGRCSWLFSVLDSVKRNHFFPRSSPSSTR